MMMKTPVVILALVTFSQVIGTAAAEELFRFQEAKHAKGELRYVRGVPVLLVQGSPDEIGEQIGTLALKQMGDIKKLVDRYLGSDQLGAVGSVAGSLLVRQFPPDCLTELNAAAKSAGWSRDLLIFGNIAIDLQKGPLCSSLIVEPERSASEKPLFGRNLDWGSELPLHQFTLVTIYRPTGKHAFASIGFAGMIGCASGINDAGLAVAANSVTETGDQSASFDPFGTPQGMTLRRVLEECTTIDGAAELIRSLRRTTSANFVICDKQRGEVVEITTKQVVVRKASDSICCCTNHFRTDPLKVNTNCDRYQILETSRSFKHLTLADVADKMDAVANSGTVQTMIFEPSALQLHLAYGESPASQFSLKPIDLSPLFQRGEFPPSDVTERHDSAIVSPEVARLENGKYSVTFRCQPANIHPVKAVYLAGTFNDWKSTALQMDGPDHQGMYRTSLQLDEGQYEYKFVINGKRWRRDLNNESVAGPYRNSVIELPK